MEGKVYCVYIMASFTGTLYVGVTSNLQRRVWQHKNGYFDGFTKKYSCHKLVYFEVVDNASSALAREKQLKGWNRLKKQKLIKTQNPKWKDLSLEIFI